MLDWMKWPYVEITVFGEKITVIPTAIVLILLLISLVTLTILDLRNPDSERRGFSPIAFSRGERFFLSIVSTVAIFLIWLALQANSVPVPVVDTTFESTNLIPPAVISSFAIFGIARYA